MGKNTAQAHHTSTYIHTSRESTAVFATQGGVSFTSRGGGSASCLHRRSPMLRQRKVHDTAAVVACCCMSICTAGYVVPFPTAAGKHDRVRQLMPVPGDRLDMYI